MVIEIGMNNRYPPPTLQKPLAGSRLATDIPLAEGLAGFWPMLEGGGRLVSDYTQKNRPGLITNASLWGGGKFGTAIDLRPGGGSSRIDAGLGAALKITGSLTISMWAYSTHPITNGNYHRYFSRLHQPSGYQGYELVRAALDAGSGLVPGSMYIQIAKGALQGVSDTIAMPLGRWVHYAASYNDTTGQFRIYRDGQLTKTQAGTGSGVGDGLSNAYIGGHPVFGGLSGLFDLTAVWNRVLRVEEVIQLYQKPFVLFEDVGNVSRWFFEFDPVGGPATYEDALEIDGTAALTIADGGTLYKEQTVAGIAAATLDAQHSAQLTLTISAVGNLTLNAPFFEFLTIAGVGALTVLDGQQWQNNFAIEGFSDLTLTPGIGYFDTVDTEAICDLTIEELAFTLLALSIDCIADIAQETLQNGRISLSVAGIAALTVEPNFSYIIDLSMAGIATIYQGSDLNGTGDDGLYDFMALTSNDTLAVALLRETPGTQNPSSAGSLSATCTGVFNRTITQTLALTQLAAIKKPTEIIDSFASLTQTVTVQRVRNQTITQTITFTHEAEAKRAVTQAITFTHSVTVQKIMSVTVSQTLTMTQSANRLTVLNRTLTQTLEMGHNRLVRTPIIGTINNSNPTGFEYYEPVVEVILVPRRCLVILGVPAQTVILPCPEFGDTQARGSTLNLKRTMTGDTFTYVRKTELQKLKYTFQMGTYKAIELQQFLLDHCHEVITLINHKGETWYVNLSNNPFEFIVAERWQRKGERHDITLEFEGVQL